MEKALKQFFTFLYYTIIGVIGIIALLFVVSTFPITGNIKFLIVQSGSMEPSITTGSLILIKQQEHYQIGQIITFNSPDNRDIPVTHRIVETFVDAGTQRFITKGDANNAPDNRTITNEDIIGRVVAKAPYVGYAVAAAQKPLGFALIIALPAGLIIGDEIRKIVKETKKLKKAQNKKETI